MKRLYMHCCLKFIGQPLLSTIGTSAQIVHTYHTRWNLTGILRAPLLIETGAQQDDCADFNPHARYPFPGSWIRALRAIAIKSASPIVGVFRSGARITLEDSAFEIQCENFPWQRRPFRSSIRKTQRQLCKGGVEKRMPCAHPIIFLLLNHVKTVGICQRTASNWTWRGNLRVRDEQWAPSLMAFSRIQSLAFWTNTGVRALLWITHPLYSSAEHTTLVSFVEINFHNRSVFAQASRFE